MVNNGMMKFNLAIEKSLLLLEIPVIRFLVICLLVIYNTLLIPAFNNVVSQWFRWFWFKLFYLLIIVYVAFKDKTISLLLAISFVLSVQYIESREEGYAHIKMRDKQRHSNLKHKDSKRNRKVRFKLSSRKKKKEQYCNTDVHENKESYCSKDHEENKEKYSGHSHFSIPSITTHEEKILSS